MKLQPDLIRQQVRCILKAARLLTKHEKEKENDKVREQVQPEAFQL